MKNRNYIIKKISGCLMFIALFLNVSLTFGQSLSSNEQHILMSYSMPFSYILEDATSWELKTSAGESIKRGVGSLENEVFNEPGDYIIQLHHVHNANSCDHGSLPEQLFIKVSTMKMEFDFSTVKLSRNIIGGSNNGVTLRVNARYSSYDNKESTYNEGFITAGIGTSIIGKLKDGSIVLQQGVNTLEFVLEGQATSGNYIMFDFVDINGEVQSYGLTQIVQ